jgi:ribulose-phosphate 3-epimerase
MSGVRIAPSILSCDFSRLGQEITDVEEAGADIIHVDVMDGHFVPNITIGPMVVAAVKRVSSKPLDVHLMIEHPDRFVVDFAKAGADFITVHAEADHHILRTFDVIKGEGKKVGVSLNPATPLSVLEYMMDAVDLILIMGVNPGFGGQAFIPAVVRKIEGAKRMIDASGRAIDLEVDGGIKASNARMIADSGAGILVLGTEIFHARSYVDKIEEIRRSLHR